METFQQEKRLWKLLQDKLLLYSVQQSAEDLFLVSVVRCGELSLVQKKRALLLMTKFHCESRSL